MNKADKYFLENLKEIVDNGSYDENPRPKYADGVPAHSIFITHVTETYDISKGEYPIPTVRNTAIKMGIQEILAIYQTQTNTQEGFESHNITWWKPWMNKDNNIGRAYSYNLESHRPDEMKKDVIKVQKRIVDRKYSEMKEIPLVNNIQPSIDNKIYFANSESPVIIIDSRTEKTDNGAYKYTIQFLNTGYKKTIRSNDFNQACKKQMFIKDYYHRTHHKIGYLGNYKAVLIDENERDILLIKWESMLKRCYGKGSHSYKAKGIFVHQDWHSFEQFLKDVKYLPQYHLAKENNFNGWELDKDYYGSNCYSKDTCTFLSKNENRRYGNNKNLKVTNKNTNEYKIFLNLISASEYIGVSSGGLNTAIKRDGRLEKGKYKLFNFEYIDTTNENYVYRYELSRNQVNELLYNLKHDMYSRRHIISLWNWANINKKMLVECAYECLFSIRKVNSEIYLDMLLTMRSSDAIMAAAINRIQYVAFQMMIAGHCNYKVGKFTIMVNNYHIYDRHIDAAKEILDRKPLNQQPSIELIGNKNFYDYTIDDFKIYNIQGIEKIKSPLEIAI